MFTPQKSGPPPHVSLARARNAQRARRVHDWRLTLLPAAIEAGQHLLALRVCKALCERQQAFHPEVFVSTRELADELGADRSNLKRELRALVDARLLAVVTGGGRLPTPRGKTGKANVYRLGAAVGRSVDALLNGVTHDPVEAPDTGSPVTPFWGKLELETGSPITPHPSGVLRTPPGDRGLTPPLNPQKRTAGSRRRAVLSPDALTGQQANTPPGLRNLFGDLNGSPKERRHVKPSDR